MWRELLHDHSNFIVQLVKMRVSFLLVLGMKFNGLCMGGLVLLEKNNEVDHGNIVEKLILELAKRLL